MHTGGAGESAHSSGTSTPRGMVVLRSGPTGDRNHHFGNDNRRHSFHGIFTSPSVGRGVTEFDLLREVLFAFQGLNGKIIISDPENDGRFILSREYINVINPSVREFALRLCNLGWLFNRINTFTTAINKDPNHGLVLQSFAAALSEEVVEFYRMISIIEQQLHFMSDAAHDDGIHESPAVSLSRLQVWTFDHFYRLKALATLVEECKKKRGGALINVVYKRMQNGDPQIRQVLTRVLKQVVLPLRRMMTQWIFQGEIDDPYKEFFIVSKSTSGLGAEFLWQERFVLQDHMLPGFIPPKDAKKILSTGKAVNLLLLSQSMSSTGCMNTIPSCGSDIATKLNLPDYEEMVDKFAKTDVECLFSQTGKPTPVSTPENPSSSTTSITGTGEFRRLLSKAHKETAMKAINVLLKDHHLIEHLHGLRQFLLLGQGDFIRHLMDLLVPELNKPAQRLQTHSLNSLLNQAILATNAQYLPEQVIQRLDCVLLDRNLNETGWDIFTLAYQTKGPIGAILTQRCMERYSKLFQHLWRSKRMEYMLTNLWKEQMSNRRLFLKVIPNLKYLLHQNSFLLQEMMHFVQQMQYYIEFEAMECSWATFQTHLQSAQDLDELVDAHETFLKVVFSRVMMDTDSRKLCEKLRAIYDLVVQFDELVGKLNKRIIKEISLVTSDASRYCSSLSLVSNSQDFDKDVIPEFVIKFKILSNSYRDLVQNFLILLADNQDLDMQFLSIRLDFNEHYKRHNKSLETSFTFGPQRRLSNSICADVSK